MPDVHVDRQGCEEAGYPAVIIGDNLYQIIGMDYWRFYKWMTPVEAVQACVEYWATGGSRIGFWDEHVMAKSDLLTTYYYASDWRLNVFGEGVESDSVCIHLERVV